MKIFHTYHRTAQSKRTEQMPLFTWDGKEVHPLGLSRKAAGYLTVPEGTLSIIQQYRSNSGIKYLRAFLAIDGLPDCWELSQNGNTPKDVETMAGYDSPLAIWAINWLWG